MMKILTYGIMKGPDCQKRKSPFEKGGYWGILIKEEIHPNPPLEKEGITFPL